MEQLPADLLYIINHVFLPPKLPQKEDNEGRQDEMLLLECERAWESFRPHIPVRRISSWASCSKMLRKMTEMRDPSGTMIPDRLESMLHSMSDGDVLSFQIRSQNAALIIRRMERHFQFEAFELSPTNEAVMSTKGRLRRFFPGPAMSVSKERMSDPSFRAAVVQIITTLDVQNIPEAGSASSEAQSSDIQDTVHPRFVTEMFFGILRGLGEPIDVHYIEKCTRDDVLSDGTLKPWRRTPFWLLLRVALQTGLATPENTDHAYYKSFMVFFMASILQRSLEVSVSSDLLFAMSAKISRRLLKLNLSNELPWMKTIHGVLEAAQQELGSRWIAIEQNPDPFQTQASWNPSALSFDQDIKLKLQNLGPYLGGIPLRKAVQEHEVGFQPQCRPRIEQSCLSFPSFNNSDSEVEIKLWLADVELWIEDFLGPWLNANSSSPKATTLLSDLIEEYTALASSAYSNSPEATSTFLLNVMDLWTALDKCAILQCPLLSQYNPEFPVSIFDHVLLPTRTQMERLRAVEDYLRQRRFLNTNSVFQSVSFAVQYYEQSPRHQQLRWRIESNAQEERKRKKFELMEKKRTYQELMRGSETLTCEYGMVWNRGRYENHHSSSCRRCQIRWEANRMDIGIHEWPLPEGEYAVKAAVFELDVPTPLADWRHATYLLLVDVFSASEPPSHRSSDEKMYYMKDYSGLSSYAKIKLSSPSRLQMASTSKSFLLERPKIFVYEATEQNTCVSNGLSYSLYDSEIKYWTKDLLGNYSIKKLCTLQLPPGPYQQLQPTLAKTTHSPNEVLAMQANCPESISLHEYYAFASLRCGSRLQWRNIARELVSRILDFGREETYLLILQAIWEVGKPGDDGLFRDSHLDLQEEGFAKSLLEVLYDALAAVEGSWQGAVATRTFIAIALRVLSLSPHNSVREQCFLFLGRARAVSLRWMRQITEILDQSKDLDALGNLSLLILEMSLTCHSAYGAERSDLPQIFSSREDVAIYVECSITIHDHCPPVTENLPLPIKSLLNRFTRRSHILELHFLQHVLHRQQGLEDTIHKTWAGYRPRGAWSSLPAPNDRWLVTTTHSEGTYSQVMVHYNVLDGSLLVNGLPLTRLPETYQLHATYRRLFGEKILTVVPSSMVGMEFEMRSGLFGQQIHFSMVDSELIVRSRSDTDDVYELIPSHFLEGDFPQALVQDYTHWMHIPTGLVEFRPLSRAWERAQTEWLIRKDPDESCRLFRDGKCLIDIGSQTSQAIARMLSPLEHPTHIHALYDSTEQKLNIHLPRYKLDFLLVSNGAALESKQFRGMVIDSVQSFGAFTGLANKLVLRNSTGASRVVLVPQGDVSFKPEGQHVRVTIDAGAAAHVQYHSYMVDSQLGRLTDNGSLQSRLFRIYLHGTTSNCLIDQLTGRTGTEEALECLGGAATRSFIELEKADVELLGLIAELTPQRQYFPDNSRESQVVDWSELSPFSQHGRYQKLVRSIFDQAQQYRIFHNTDVRLPEPASRAAQHLLIRASIRDSSFQVHGYGAESHTSEYDAVYVSRDPASGSHRELHACHTARLVDTWSQDLRTHPQLLVEIESWGEAIKDFRTADSHAFGFDMRWLEAPNKVFPASLYALHQDLTQASKEQDKYKVMMLLSTLAYSEHAKQDLVQTLLAFATVPELRALQLPDGPIFKLSDGYLPVRQRLAALVETHFRSFDDCPESKLLKLPGETRRILDRRREDEYYIAKAQHVEAFVEELMLKAPSGDLSSLSISEHNSHIRVDEAIRALQSWFESWHQNAQFQQQIGRVQVVLNRLQHEQCHPDLLTFPPPESKYIRKRTHIRFLDLVEHATAPGHSLDGDYFFRTWVAHSQEKVADRSHVKNLLDNVTSRCSSKHDKRYAADLLESYEALRGDVSATLAVPDLLVPLLEKHLERTRFQENYLYNKICSYLVNGTSHKSKHSYMRPRLSKLSILSHLASDKISALPSAWRKLFMQYAMSITVLQRAERLLKAAGNPAELLSELQNQGHQNWNVDEHPEWLLVEIESNIIIRQEQSQIAREMISPSSGSNSVLQLSMGLGKTSVIVPLSAATLADSTKIVRVVVLKQLAMQMFNILRQKVGGLLNRRIVYMPFTRSLKLDEFHAIQIHNMLKDCMKTGAILLMQPEHILSFELMGFEKLLSHDLQVGKILTRTQNWLEANSRDIIDESDEILSVKYELIYTMGTQVSTEFSPDRWNIISGVLDILGKRVHKSLEAFPGGLEVIATQAGAFPRVRIIQKTAGGALLDSVAQHVCEHGLPGVPVWRLPRSKRKALFRFLLDRSLSVESTSAHEFASGSESVEKALLLLKGLLGKGVLSFCLAQKRWRVHYGLHLTRTKLAVPYYAKDTPSPRTEFSHPDATIVFTCLSYYYGGLSVDQMVASFEALLQSDHAPEEYAHWVQDTPQLPAAFRQLTGVNLGNLQQFRQKIYPPLRFRTRIINFYLSNIVFPAEMKEFPQKLSSSGWDIAQEKCHPTTGFSGTNDSRYHLPLSISQRDLPQQLSTNAGVLSCILRPENVVVDISQASASGTCDATALIKMASLLDPPARVILDVGAQVLDVQNQEMAWKWLMSVPDSEAQAVIFFDSRNDICVLSRDGSQELLEVSAFLKQMDLCLVYLDEAHTRGTDLKMPTNYRAIVTLGPALTKDRLVQACMRLRKLGEGQSVALCCSSEIQRNIVSFKSKDDGQKIGVSDVLEWSIANTCADSRKSIPLWATQGMRYQRRHVICTQPLIDSEGEVARNLVKNLPEQEAQSIHERYGTNKSKTDEHFLSGTINDDSLRGREQQVTAIVAKCEELGLSAFDMANLYEEQERELSPENEREKEIVRPPPALPYKHSIEADIESIVTHGVLNRLSTVLRPAFDSLRQSSAETYFDDSWPKDVLVTADFAQAVHGVEKQFLDAYLRPVNWVLSCKEGSATSLVIVSPFEVQELMPLIRKHKRVTLHVYAPRLNMSTRQLEDLSFCSIPPVSKAWLAPPVVRHLNLFAGQLYIKDYDEYIALCGFLGLSSKAPEGNMEIGADGFVRPSSRATSNAVVMRESPFRTSPVEFLRMILAIRRKGQSFTMSHMGKILNGELITEESFSV